MDFIDEKCAVFDSSEENKFSYSDIHKDFCDHVEALMTENLGELGITIELFFVSCQKSRNNRSINQIVFERLTAIDDFQTFKKVMIRRNIELQIEAMEKFQEEGDTTYDNLNKPDKLRLMEEMRSKIMDEYDCEFDDDKVFIDK
jgi:hypothetical protein